MTNSSLSPAAQVVLDAVCANTEPDCDTQHIIAAALRAAADQVVLEEEEPVDPPGYGIGCEPSEHMAAWTRWSTRHQLLAIAAELEQS